MKTKNLLCVITLTLVAPFFTVTANTSKPTTKSENLVICKKTALTRREQIVTPALQEYVANSEAVTENAKNKFESIKWYVDTSYMVNSKKIQDEKKQAMVPVNKKIAQIRAVADATWKADDALCDFHFSTSTSSSKKVTKK